MVLRIDTVRKDWLEAMLPAALVPLSPRFIFPIQSRSQEVFLLLNNTRTAMRSKPFADFRRSSPPLSGRHRQSVTGILV